jgi:Armadillo/beta-catenin-like repeat
MLVEIAAAAQESSCGEHEADSAATLAFRKAVVRAGGIRAIVRALRASYASEFEVLCRTDAATLVGELALESSGARRALVAAGCVRPLVALLASPSVNVQESVSCELCNLSADDGPKRIILASESGTVLPLLVTLAQSPFGEVRQPASHALHNLRTPVRVARAPPPRPDARAAA